MSSLRYAGMLVALSAPLSAQFVLGPPTTSTLIAGVSFGAPAVGDVTGDGLPDLLTAEDGFIALAVNQGDGTFVAPVNILPDDANAGEGEDAREGQQRSTGVEQAEALRTRVEHAPAN